MDRQTVGSNVGDQQTQRLRDSQPGCCQQADERRIGLSLQRFGRRKPHRGEDKVVDLVARINVRHASILPVAEVVRRWRFVPRVFYAKVLSKTADSLISRMSLRDRSRQAGPV